MGSDTARLGTTDIEQLIHRHPCVVGRPKYYELLSPSLPKTIYCGENAWERRAILDLERPVRGGVFQDLGNTFRILEDLINSNLRVDFEEGLILAVDLRHTHSQVEQILEQGFEAVYDFRTVTLVDPGIALAHALGITNGITVDVGAQSTKVHWIQDGRIVSGHSHYPDLGGDHITERLLSLLVSNKRQLTLTMEGEIARDLKHSYCNAWKSGSEMDISDFPFILPDFKVINVSEEVYLAPDALFGPQTAEKPGIQCAIAEVYSEYSKLHKTEPRMMLAGGTCSMSGFQTRLVKEVRKLLPPSNPELEFDNSGIVSKLNPSDRVMYGLQQLGNFDTLLETLGICRTKYQEEGANRLCARVFEQQTCRID